MNARLVLACAVVSVPGGVTAQSLEPLVHEAVVEASIDDVWNLWATSDGLRSWLAPHAEIDMRIGGKMRSNYDPAGTLGDPQTIENTILTYDPPRMFSMRVSKAPEDFPFSKAIYEMWTVVYLYPDGADRTRIRIVSSGFSADPESQSMRAFFEQGNAETLEQLRNSLSAP